MWQTSYKVIERVDANLWYAFVWLNGWPHTETLPEVFFVPSKVVIKCLEDCQAENDNYPTFWIRCDDAKKFQGLAGLQAFLAALTS